MIHRLILSVLLAFMLNVTFAQKDTIYLNEIYDDVNSFLVTEEILLFDKTTTQDLMNKFNEWGNRKFRNYNDINTSIIDSQIIVSYTTSSFMIDMYVIMKVEFKNAKIRVRIYDDGNLFRKGYYVFDDYRPAKESRTFFVKSYFDQNDLILYKKKKKKKQALFNYKYSLALDALSYKKEANDIIKEIKDYIINSDAKDNW